MADKFRIYQGEQLLLEGDSPLTFLNSLRNQMGFLGPLSVSRVRGTKESEKVSLPALVGKKMVCFGDSITYYDGHEFDAATKPEWQGKTAYGYESYLRQAFGGIVENQGIGGQRTDQIANRSKSFNYDGYEAVTFYCGVNDWNQKRTVGQVQAIGSSFDTNTFAGAYQSMIEDVLNRFPTIKVGIILPYKVWKQNVVLTKTYIDQTVQLAQLYALPYLDLYGCSGINELNRDALFVDDKSRENKHFHVNNHGYAMIGPKVVQFVEKLIGN